VEQTGFEQLQGMLAARGVTWQRLELVEGDLWKFSCAIPKRDNPSIRSNFEVQATGPGGLAAMRAVIAEIDKVQGGR
jgi:hypothetical protein